MFDPRHKTVASLWKEWKYGMNGYPAVEDLEIKYRSKWRRSESERKFFNNRKVILDRVRFHIESRLTEKQAVEMCDFERLTMRIKN